MSLKTILYLGFRPFIPKKHGIRGVVIHTILVVAIAMLPLVVVLMVADGMIQGITNRYIETSSYHFRVYSRQPADIIDFDKYEKTRQNILMIPEITAANIERTGAGVSVYNEYKNGVQIRGLDPGIIENDPGMMEYITVEKGDFDISEDNNVVLSSYLARKMKVELNDEIRVITGKVLKNGKVLPKVTKMNIKGVVKTGYEDLDKLWFITSLNMSKKILPNKSSETFIGIKCEAPYADLNNIYMEIKKKLPSGWIIRTWIQLNRNTYENFKTTKMVLALIMGLIVVVAAINISSSLIMLVLEKRRDIAILKGMGLSPGEVMGSYLLTGVIIGVVGTIIGVIFGVLISLNINQLILFFEMIINLIYTGMNFILNIDSEKSFIFLDSEYYLDNIPVELNYIKLLLMTFFSIATTAVASFLPARKAGLIKPLQVMQKY